MLLVILIIKIYIINNTMRPKRNLKVSVNDDLNC